MPEEITVQILSQASENIQKLFDLSTRIDERVKTILIVQHDMDDGMASLLKNHNELLQQVAIMESKDTDIKIHECEKALIAMDKRVSAVEGSSNQGQDRWNRAVTFGIQLVWVILAAWLLMKFNLQPPAVP